MYLGENKTPKGAYAAVIPKFVAQLMQLESPVINGDGNYSRDFTYIDNVIQMNELAMTTQNPVAVNTVFNTAYGDRNTLNDLVGYLKEYLSIYNPKIAEVAIEYGPNRSRGHPPFFGQYRESENLVGL